MIKIEIHQIRLDNERKQSEETLDKLWKKEKQWIVFG